MEHSAAPSMASAHGAAPTAMERLVAAIQDLSTARTLEAVMAVVRRAARVLTGADGATFILRDGMACHYVDEDAVQPLWKGRRFPLSACISGWAMQHRQAVIVPDIFKDGRIPLDLYRRTFVKSLVIVPIRAAEPIGAIGNYWALPHAATDDEVRVLQALADSTSVALENVRLYAELQERLRRSEDSVRLRDEFIAVAAHELRTPLTALQLQLQSLKRADAAGPHVDRALASTRRLARLVETLLDASTISIEGVALQRQRVELLELARAACARFAEQAQRAGCTLTVDAPAPVQGLWDAARIEQVVENLLSNAVKYGAGAPVQVVVSRDGARARLAVRNGGEPIPAADLQRIFERFERAASTRNYAGLGLGLYVSRAIVEAHGGTIGVSQEGGAVEFRVELPL